MYLSSWCLYSSMATPWGEPLVALKMYCFGTIGNKCAWDYNKSMILGLFITIPGALILHLCPNGTLFFKWRNRYTETVMSHGNLGYVIPKKNSIMLFNQPFLWPFLSSYLESMLNNRPISTNRVAVTTCLCAVHTPKQKVSDYNFNIHKSFLGHYMYKVLMCCVSTHQMISTFTKSQKLLLSECFRFFVVDYYKRLFRQIIFIHSATISHQKCCRCWDPNGFNEGQLKRDRKCVCNNGPILMFIVYITWYSLLNILDYYPKKSCTNQCPRNFEVTKPLYLRKAV